MIGEMAHRTAAKIWAQVAVDRTARAVASASTFNMGRALTHARAALYCLAKMLEETAKAERCKQTT